MTQFDSDTPGAFDPGQSIRVLVADDHPLTRLGIRHALGDGFEVCAEAGDAEGALAAAQREQPDICLLDVRMPGNGIQAAARISAEVPRAAIVMISAAGDHDTLLAALRAGAVGYLSKDAAFTRLPEALRGVLDGEAAVPRDVTARPPMRANASLTARETDVLELLLEGLATVEIGRKLFLTPPTVRSHVAALLRKFGVRDREALRARFAEADPLRQADRL